MPKKGPLHSAEFVPEESGTDNCPVKIRCGAWREPVARRARWVCNLKASSLARENRGHRVSNHRLQLVQFMFTDLERLESARVGIDVSAEAFRSGRCLLRALVKKALLLRGDWLSQARLR